MDNNEEQSVKVNNSKLLRLIAIVLCAVQVVLILFTVTRVKTNHAVRKHHDRLEQASSIGMLRPPFCRDSKRCRPLDVTKSFSFVHVAKCAGSSIIHEMLELVPRFNPKVEAGIEHPVPYQRKKFPGYYMMMSLKSPRHHVWSMFSECKYSAFGTGATKGKDFPRTGTTPESDVADFEAWLGHFDQNLPYATDTCFGCYDPSNFQSHHLTSNRANQHCHPESPTVDMVLANETYWNLDWVALTDFYHESKCVLFHRMLMTPSESIQEDSNMEMLERSMKRMKDYVDEECVCPRTRFSDARVTHHELGHRSTVRDLPERILDMISRLTKTDVEIYKLALDQLLQEVVWMENFEVGHRVMCDDVLHKVTPKLMYLGMNVTERYHELKEEYIPVWKAFDGLNL